MSSFTCPRCGAVSHHPMDAREGYCGRCHDFTGFVPITDYAEEPIPPDGRIGSVDLGVHVYRQPWWRRALGWLLRDE